MVQGARVNGVGHTYLEFSRCPLSAVNSNPEADPQSASPLLYVLHCRIILGSYWIMFLLENEFNILFKFYVGSRSSPIYECQRVRFCCSNGRAALNLAYYS